jgi:hypothetical protein
MAKRKTLRTNFEQESVKRIFTALLAEFKQRALGVEDLRNGYEGMAPAELKQVCCADGDVSEVDFDLALSDLEQDNLVETGPREHVKNDPNSMVLMIGFFVSKREYSYLLEEGYKAATKIKPTRMAGVQHIHFSGNFHQSSIGVGDHSSQSVNVAATNTEMFARLREEIQARIEDHQKCSEALSRLDALEAAQDKPSRIERYTQLVGVLGDHITVLTFLLTPLFQNLIK